MKTIAAAADDDDANTITRVQLPHYNCQITGHRQTNVKYINRCLRINFNVHRIILNKVGLQILTINFVVNY